MTIAQNWDQICRISDSFISVKWKSFHWCFINRAITTNSQLHTMGLTNSSLCMFCKQEAETFYHLFWECSVVEALWTQVITWCQCYIDDQFEYNAVSCLLMGSKKKVLNNVFLACKYFIHIQHLFHGWLDFDVFLRRVKSWRFRDRNAIYVLLYLKQGKYLIHWGHIPEIAFRT